LQATKPSKFEAALLESIDIDTNPAMEMPSTTRPLVRSLITPLEQQLNPQVNQARSKKMKKEAKKRRMAMQNGTLPSSSAANSSGIVFYERDAESEDDTARQQHNMFDFGDLVGGLPGTVDDDEDL
jgi:hypothetical protein